MIHTAVMVDAEFGRVRERGASTACLLRPIAGAWFHALRDDRAVPCAPTFDVGNASGMLSSLQAFLADRQQ